jgi:hypothetical protein
VPLGDLAQWEGLAGTGARIQDINPALFPLHRFKQAVEIVEVGCVTANAGHVSADLLDSLIKRFLPAAGDEDVRAFLDEPFGALERHAARSARDDRDFAVKLSHDLLLSGAAFGRREPLRAEHGSAKVAR